MQIDSCTAGRMLRQLRTQRHLTLHQAAPRFNISLAALSRKERDIDAIEREDIRCAITGYELNPWEAYTLWIAAGYLPDPPPPDTQQPALQHLARPLLAGLHFPAFITDVAGYLLGWNHEYEQVWFTSRSSWPRPHLLRDLFTAQNRSGLDQEWESFVCQIMLLFHRKTLRIAHHLGFRQLLKSLERDCGAEFVQLWNRAQSQRAQSPAVILRLPGPSGVIEYVLTELYLQELAGFDLYTYVPLIGTDSPADGAAQAKDFPVYFAADNARG
jgi:transcriptional regulator with XRE-family HTH domain